jgi:riboflavin kinase
MQETCVTDFPCRRSCRKKQSFSFSRSLDLLNEKYFSAFLSYLFFFLMFHSIFFFRDLRLMLQREMIWGLRGLVVHGHGRGGSQLGFPTANIELDEETTQRLMPMSNWVYGGWGVVESSADTSSGSPLVLPFVMSVGFNPHFKDKALTVEVHFMHRFASDFYGSVARIVACYCIREQAAFTTLEALIEIIKRDCHDAATKLPNQFPAAASHPFLHSKTPEQSSMPYLVAPLSVKSSDL